MRSKHSQPSQGQTKGPRTAEGRKRVSQNARTHGLAARPLDSSAINTQIEAWAVASPTDTAPTADLARLAQARLQVARARAHQAALLESISAETPSTGETANQAVAQFCLSLRYRSEAEASARKALREVVKHLVDAHREEDG
jgi:hypothetical protein